MNLETASPGWKTIAVSDGTSMRVYIARPKPGPAKVAAVLVLQEAFGVNAHIQDVAGRFAREGFLAIAPELYHRTAEGFDAPYSDFASAIPHLQAITTANLVADLQATFDQVVKEPRADPGQVAVVGYCLGGRAAFIANAVLPLRAAVSYYGGRIHLLLDQAKDQHGPLLLFWGGQDEHIPAEQIRPIGDALRGAGKAYTEVTFSEADHGFFCDQRESYHPPSAQQSWELTLRFLKDSGLKSVGPFNSTD